MFRCYFCGQITPPKTTRHTVVIEVREKQYSSRRRESKRGGGGGGRGGFRGREEPVQDRGGRGEEISKEVAACPACASKQHEAKMIAAPTPAPPESAEPQGETETGTDS
ncbi:MAG: hypothetical protein HKN47_27070 [Pirellulaceae bacterium]|nr:hypothetical protein [Pirellulaceae bacterium]